MNTKSEFKEPRTFTEEILLEGIDYDVLALRRRIAIKTKLKNYLFFCIGLLGAVGLGAVLFLFLRINHYI